MKRLIAIFFVLALLPFTAHAAAPNPDVNTVFASETQLTVYVDNEWSDTLSGSYGFGDTATLNAPTIDGKVFSHWEADGSIVSYSNPLKLTMNAHTTLYAIYADTAPTTKSVTGFTSITRTNDGSKISFQAIADGTVTNAGVVYSTVTFGDELKIGGSSVTNVEAEKITDSTTTLPKSVLDDNNNWMVQITPDNEDTVYYARAYAISGSATTYGDVKEVKPSELESGISLVANLEGFDHTTSLSTLLASLTSTMHTVTYEANGGIGATIVQAFSGSSVTLKINTFTREWYTFTGWNTQANGKGTSYQDGASVSLTENTTLYAQWKPIQYAISYNLNNGMLSASNPLSYDVESADIKLNKPIKTGYTFTGWTGTGLTAASTDVIIPRGTTGNREYVANWRVNNYAVKFATNGGSGSMSDQSFTYDQEQALSNNAFTRNGYTFKLWKDNASNTTYTNGQTVKNLTDADNGIITLNAQWTANAYKISFDLNGGELGEGQINPTNYDIESEKFSPNAPTKKGYDFEGWLLSGETTGTVSKDLTIPTGTTGDREYIAQWSLHVYALSYDLQGGIASPDNPTSYTIESADIKLTRPTKHGYDFTGWSFDAEISLDVTLPKGSTGDRNYVATWGIITSTISYDLQGGNVSGTNPTSYNCEANTFKLTTPTRTGYTFAGWTGTGITGTSTDVTIPTGSTGNREYAATWTAIEYTISYTLNNGSVSGNPDKYTIESEAITLNNPTKNGYTFTGWTGTDLNGKTQTLTISKGSTGNRNYTANFTPITYTISYELNGGSLSTANPTSYDIETATFYLTAPTKEGYTFEGWTGTGLTGATKVVTIAVNSTGNRSYTANWTLIQSDVSFDLNGGVFKDGNPTSYNSETDKFTLKNPTRDGYEFIGWNRDGESELSLNVEIQRGTTDNRKYIANWKTVKYSLNYELNGGTVSPDNPVSYDIESETFTLNNPTRTGYTFKGWTGTSLDAATEEVTITYGSIGDRSYTAEWTVNIYTLSYDLNGGTIAPDKPEKYTVESDDIKLIRPTKQGYSFTGWSFDNEISIDVTLPKGSTGNREYVATWTAIEYTISYTLNNSSVSGNPDKYTIESEAITLNNPTKNGYTFTGWTGTDLNGKTQTVTISKGSTENRSYTANFTPITYTISYELNGGTNNAENPTSYTIESATVTLKAPTRDGYNFGGWTFNGEAISEIAQGSTGNKTLTATWVETHGEMKPVISPASYALTVYKRQSSSLTLNATGTNLKWNMSGNLPAGMTFSSAANSATISGTPETGTSGSYSVTVTAANALGSASANVTITVANDSAESVDVEAGTPVTTTTENGGSMTTTQTAFKSGTGQTILTADVSITTESEDFEAVAGNPFTTTIKVDVSLNVADKNYNSYMYEMTLAGLPEWLIAEGELESDDVLETGETQYHHEFTLTGTPPTSKDTETLTLTATVKVSGDIPTLEASGSKEVNISVSAPDSERSSAVLQSMSVKILGDDTLTTNAGASSSITFTANVQGTYSDGQTRILPAGSYALTWSASESYGFSFADGTLRINANAPAGTHEIQITATAVSSDVSGTGVKAVTVTVQGVADVPTVPVLTCTTTNATVNRGATIVALTVIADTTPQEWLPSGELPEGLSYIADGNKFVISGTISQNSEARAYVCTVRARNEAGTSEAITITITVTATGTATGTGTSERVEVSAGEISAMTDEEIVATLGNKTDIALTGNVENLSETIARLETVTNVKTLDLSQVTGVSELKLEQTSLESITLEGNQSIKTVAVTGNATLTALNLSGSAVETVDAEGCENLESVNVEGAINLTTLNVKATQITTLNVKDCANLTMLDAKGCQKLETVNLEGCESLEYLDVSETKITELDVKDCANLQTLNCASSDVKQINLEGCEKLDTLDCSYNSLLVFKATGLTNLHHLECRHQRVYNKPLARLMNFLDLLLGRGAFSSSVADENDSAILSNVENMKAYDATGQELAVEFDRESGEVMFSGEPAKIGYDYVTGFNGMMMDVEVYPSENQTEESGSLNVLGPSGGGCTSGFEMGALGVLLLLMILPRKKATE